MEKTKSLLREIFVEAAEIAEPVARAAYLNQACGGDAALRVRVEQLLAADSQAGKFLHEPGDTTATRELFSEKLGDRIGRYRLIERIGRGGGGVVYLAEQEEPVRRRVALKVLKVGMDTQAFVARFEAERQALAMMDHPNIAKVLDAGATETGRPFFVMELVNGLKFSEYCERHGLSTRQRLELFIPVCHAIQHAHQKGIVHRDLKPSNILVTEHEGVAVPKVIDFGIAKATEQTLDAASGLTSADQFLGTPAYMSPEQVEFGGRDIDTRSDIYSLGVILYELLVGHPPFDPKLLSRAGLDEMRRLIREVDPPKPSTTFTKNLNPARLPMPGQISRERLAAVRGDLDWIVMKCLEKDRARRYETANGLAMDLRRHLDDEPVIARPPSQWYRLQKVFRRHRIVFGATAVIAVVLVLAVIVSANQALRARRAERKQSELRGVAESRAEESRQRLIRRYVAEGNRLAEEGLPLVALPWLVEALALETGDAQREADERLRIAQTMIGAPALAANFALGRWVHCVALSPDGERVAAGSDDGTVRIADVNSGGERGTNVVMPAAVRTVRFDSAGQRVVAMDATAQVRVWDATSGAALTPLLRAEDFNAKSVANHTDDLRPAASFSPDGNSLLVAWGSKSAQLRDASSGQLVRELKHDDVVYHATFSPDGKWIATSSRDGTARVWDVATGALAGPMLQHTQFVAWAQFSADGSTLLTVRNLHFIQLWNWRTGERIAPEIPRRSELAHASLSRNGNNVFSVAWSGYAQVYDAMTSRRVNEFEHQGGLVDAAFKPDGRSVAIACHDGNVWLWDINDMAHRPTLLPEGNQIEQIAFSADGRRLAVGTRGGRARVWDLSPAEPGVRHLPGREVQWVRFDPTGRRALVVSTVEPYAMDVFDTRDGRLVRSITTRGHVHRAQFSRDGARGVGLTTGRTAVVFETESGKTLHRLPTKIRPRDVVWSPDGQNLFVATSAEVRQWNVATGKAAATFSRSNTVEAMTLAGDGKMLATAHNDHTVWLWRVGGAESPRLLVQTVERIRELQFSPDGRALAIATQSALGEGSVELREVASGKVIGTPLRHRDRVNEVQFSRDGRWVATAGDDHTVRVWDVLTGEPVSPWLPHDFEARRVCFSDDGLRLLTQARRGATRLWNAQTGEPITPPILYPRISGNGDVDYSPDGKRLLISRGGNEAILRELQPTTATLDELRRWAQVVSCTRFDPAAGMVPLDEAGLKEAWQQLRRASVPR